VILELKLLYGTVSVEVDIEPNEEWPPAVPTIIFTIPAGCINGFINLANELLATTNSTSVSFKNVIVYCAWFSLVLGKDI